MATPQSMGMEPLELGTPGAMRQGLNALVLSGRKVASFGLLEEYEAAGDPVEDVGDLMGLVDDGGQWIATVEIIDVQRLRFGDATWAQVEAEGEGFPDVASWARGHIEHWHSVGYDVTGDSELVWSRHRVVDPVPTLPPRPTAGDLGLPEGYEHVYGGKVRDLFRAPTGHLLVVASDRISAYDWVLPTPIPDKGAILTQMSLWWFQQLADLVANHVVTADVPAGVAGRAVECRSLEMAPVECVVRGYLTGSGLVDYQATGAVCGVTLPAGLVDGDRLPMPIFTPATKAAVGEHDENVDFAAVEATVGADLAAELRATSVACYQRAEAISRDRGILLADTKFEFGRPPGAPDAPIVLADEVLTPDSSRFWPADQWRPGGPQPSFDKQFVRDWLTSGESGWDRAGGTPPPPLPDRVVAQTRDRYVEAYERITGTRFAP